MCATDQSGCLSSAPPPPPVTDTVIYLCANEFASAQCGAKVTRPQAPPFRGEDFARGSLDAFKNAHVVRNGGPAHVEDAAEPSIFDLHLTGFFGGLHCGERMHRHAGGANRMAFGFKSTGRIDRQFTVLPRPAFLDRASALAFGNKAHRLVLDQLGNGKAVVRL